MGGDTTHPLFLRNAAFCIALSLSSVLPLFPAYAIDNSTDPYSAGYYSSQRPSTLFANNDQTDLKNQMTSYLRKQEFGVASSLAPIIRSPNEWAQSGLGLDRPTDISPENISLVPAAPETPEAMWLSPGYHHKGFFPLDDALVMGVNYRHRLFEDGLQLDVHPFYGQNWHNTNGYYGSEIGLGLRDQKDGHEWGRIALRYNNGDESLMDETRGFDMHGELNFDQHLSLNAGLRESEDSDYGNYIVLRWKLGGF
ncbi:MAG TPA: hypothetical protein VFR09_02450 [Alphaproteobacteria bacterium]|nr:hypothetical protein [Alphaproteobacteria bacterium]